MYILNTHASLVQLSTLLWQIRAGAKAVPGDMMFPVFDAPIGLDNEAYMMFDSSFEIRFTQDMTTQIKALILGMDNTLSSQVIDNVANSLIQAGEMTFGTILSNLGVQTRDYDYMINNGYITEGV